MAFAIQENLDFDANVTVWIQGIYFPSASVLGDLIAAMERSEFGAFVFTPDDVVQIRGEQHRVARDNVIFELGLFYGGLGRDQCFIVMPRDNGPIHLSTDLLAPMPLTYWAHRSDGDLVAALGAACNKMRKAFRTKAQEHEPVSAGPSRTYALMSLDDYVSQWNGPALAKARENIREVVLDHYSPEFAAQRGDIKRIFAFLEGLSDAVIDGAIDEHQARAAFGRFVISFWPVAATMLAPPNHVDDWWDPVPKIASLFKRWKADQ